MDRRIRLGNLVVDLDGHLVLVGPRRVELTYLEFRALSILARRAGLVVPAEDLARAVWGHARDGQTERLRSLIHRLRKKLRSMHPWQICTARKRGYGLILPGGTATGVTVAGEEAAPGA